MLVLMNRVRGFGAMRCGRDGSSRAGRARVVLLVLFVLLLASCGEGTTGEVDRSGASSTSTSVTAPAGTTAADARASAGNSRAVDSWIRISTIERYTSAGETFAVKINSPLPDVRVEVWYPGSDELTVIHTGQVVPKEWTIIEWQIPADAALGTLKVRAWGLKPDGPQPDWMFVDLTFGILDASDARR